MIVVVWLQSQVYILNVGRVPYMGMAMDYPNGKSRLIRKDFSNGRGEGIDHNSLKDVPLEVRRKEARRPLFLTRYE